MPKSRAPYPPEFRAEAIRLVRSSGKPMAQIARELDVTSETLRIWVKQADTTKPGQLQDIQSRCALSDYLHGHLLSLLDHRSTETEVRQDEATPIQQVEFLSRQGPASHRESSLAWWEVTSITKRRQSDRQATTQVKRLSPVTGVMQMPTASPCGKALVEAGTFLPDL